MKALQIMLAALCVGCVERTRTQRPVRYDPIYEAERDVELLKAEINMLEGIGQLGSWQTPSEIMLGIPRQQYRAESERYELRMAQERLEALKRRRYGHP